MGDYTMNLLFGHDRAVADWVAARARGKQIGDPMTAIGLVDETGHLRGGFVFTGFNGDCIEMSAAGSILTHGAWQAVLQYVFGQLGCSRLQMHTRRSNKRVLRMLAPTRGGFTYEGISRRFYGREDGIVYSLTVDDLPAFRRRWRLPA